MVGFERPFFMLKIKCHGGDYQFFNYLSEPNLKLYLMKKSSFNLIGSFASVSLFLELQTKCKKCRLNIISFLHFFF